MKGTAQGGAISFTVADGESYRNREQLYYADEGAWNRLYGGRLADGNLLVCWNRVSRVLSSGQEEEQDPELGTLYWPYETYRYDLMVSLLDAAGTPLDTVALATELTGSRGTLFAGPLAPPLLLADGRAVLCLNLQNGHPAAGRAARLVAVEAGKMVLQEAPEVFLEEARWEKLADVEGDSILARVTAWGDTGPRAMDRFRPQLAYYRMRGDRVTRLYRADCPGETVSTAQAGSYHWNAEWSAAGRVLVFGGRWSPRAGDLVRLVARWESGYREGTAGESYAGLCVRGTDQNGTFGLMAPGEA